MYFIQNLVYGINLNTQYTKVLCIEPQALVYSTIDVIYIIYYYVHYTVLYSISRDMNLRMLLEHFHRRVVRRAKRRKVDQHVRLLELAQPVVHVLVHYKHSTSSEWQIVPDALRVLLVCTRGGPKVTRLFLIFQAVNKIMVI